MAECALIIGAAGFVGRHLTAYLADQGLEVSGVDRPRVSPPDGWSGKWYSGDVTVLDQIIPILQQSKPDYIFHLASLIRSNSLSDLLSVNVIGTQNILDGVKAVNPDSRVLITGSSAEYGISKSDELPIHEGNPLRPLNQYGLSKLAQSLLAAQYAWRNGLHIVRTRTFNITGPGEPDTLVCSAFARQIVSIENGFQQAIIKVGNLKSTRDFIDIRDAVRAYWLVVQKGEPGDVLNVCSGVGVSIQSVLETLLGLTSIGEEIQLEIMNSTSSDVPRQVGDYSRLHALTRWQPEISIQRSLIDLITYWRHYYG